MHRFFISPDQIAQHVIQFDGEQARQMRRVLRLEPGDRVLALDGLGGQYEIVLAEVTNGRVSGHVIAESAAQGEPAAHLTLFQSLLRREKFEWVLQKGTEVGVSTFVPVITRRSLVRGGEDVTPERMGRWQRIIKEAAEQSGRGLLPVLRPPVSFRTAVGQIAADACTLIAWEGVTHPSLRGALRDKAATREMALFIGPEGGYDPDEIDEATAGGAIPITLGRRILRTETAAIVGAALILHELGDLE